MSKVSFIGLGVMGYPMAGYISKAGHDVTVYNRTKSKAEKWIKDYKGKIAETPAEAAKDSNFVFTCVGNDDDLKEVAIGKNGIFNTIKKGSIYIHAGSTLHRLKVKKGTRRVLHFEFTAGSNILYDSRIVAKCLSNEFDIEKIDKKFVNESKRLLPDKNYVGLSITQGNVYRKKEWPLNKVIKLSEELVKNNKIPVFLLEKKYLELKNKIKNSIPSALFPEHETSLDSPALVTCLGERMDLIITIDNGIMHMLSLSKIPIISLFGPTDPLKFAPRHKNSKVLDSKKIYNSKNVSDITVEDVLLAARQLVNF